MYKLPLIKFLRLKYILAPISFFCIFIFGLVGNYFFGNTMVPAIMAFIWLLIFLGTVEFVDGYTVNGKIEFTKTNIIINENNDKRTFEFINIDHIKIVYDSYEGGGHKYVVSRWQGIENEEGIGSIHIYGIDKSMSSYNYVARNANTIVMINKLLEEYKSLGIRIELQTI